jgi:hypothetical protein
MVEWVLKPSASFERKLKQYQKKHQAAALATLGNLDAYFEALKTGIPPTQITAGFIHPEPQGLIAIDQKGARGHPRATRLYVYAAVVHTTLHLITIGDKDSQKRDLEECRRFITKLRREA